MKSVTRVPFLIFFIAFITGLLAEKYSPAEVSVFLFPAPVLFALSYFALRRATSGRYEFLPGIFAVLSMALLGSFCQKMQTRTPVNHISKLENCEVTVDARVISDFRETKYGYKVWIEPTTLIGNHRTFGLDGKAVLYFDDRVPCPAQFDHIRTKIEILPVKTQYEGYRAYLQSKGIRNTARCRSLEITGQSQSFAFHVEQFRKTLAGRLAACIPTEASAGIAVAMLLGDKSGLDDEVREDFQVSGLAHLLAISGMHVGIIFLFVYHLLKLPVRTKRGLKIAQIACIGLLVLYAVLTGGSPAVCRAVFMFSCLLVAKIFYLRKNSLNILAFSAFMLLFWNPGLLFNIGFQLSYAAVAGILLCHQRLSERLQREWPGVRKEIFEVLSMSLTAQAFTAPLVLYHFGTFPTWFLLSNLLIFPFAWLAVNLGFVTLLLCFVPGLNALVGLALDWLLRAVVFLADFVANLPGTTVERFSLTDPGIWVLAGCLLIIALLLYRARIRMYGKLLLERIMLNLTAAEA